MFPLEEGEKITAILPVKQFDDGHFIFMATAHGTVKKTPLSAISPIRARQGIIAVELDEGDYLIGVAITDGKHDVMLFSDAGKAVRFDEDDVRPMGRVTRGVRGMHARGRPARDLDAGGRERERRPCSPQPKTASASAPRSPSTLAMAAARKGMIAIQTSERNGKVVGATLVEEKDEIMLISTGGVLIRTKVAQIRENGARDPGRDPDQPRRRHASGRHRESAGIRRRQRSSNGNGNGHGESKPVPKASDAERHPFTRPHAKG